MGGGYEAIEWMDTVKGMEFRRGKEKEEKECIYLVYKMYWTLM